MKRKTELSFQDYPLRYNTDKCKRRQQTYIHLQPDLNFKSTKRRQNVLGSATNAMTEYR